MKITIEHPEVPVDQNGQAIEAHVASHHVGHGQEAGEVTLCGVYIQYATWQGTAPNAPACAECARLDC